MRPWDELNGRIVACERCPRLRRYCRRVGRERRRAFRDWSYWAQPVPNFGDSRARVLIVGLAPAAHGGNRTGRLFTGDRSGDWLFRALHKAGFANEPNSTALDDGLRLTRAAITATCHCAPPLNKPTRRELANCRQWLDDTIDLLPVRVFLALGHIAWRAVLDAARRRSWLASAPPRFAHCATSPLADKRWLVASYHPSQQNTFTGRLTEEMFDSVFGLVRRLSDDAKA